MAFPSFEQLATGLGTLPYLGTCPKLLLSIEMFHMYLPSFWIQVPLLHGFKNRDERNERCIVFQNVFQGQPASWRDFHTATAIGRYMYIFGGRGNSQTVNLCGLCCLVMVGSMGSVYFFLRTLR